jgi:16S rRNA (uracil1498-N3)-methyltransferase
MKNVPRIFINQEIEPGKTIPADKDVVHYLKNVMRTDKCLVFHNGIEFFAALSSDSKSLVIGNQTDHSDPGNKITLYFAPIKKTDDMLNMATQQGAARFQPVITDRTVAHHINWRRIEKIIIEASEQSGRNSIPELLPAIKFADLDKVGLVFADERAATGRELERLTVPADRVLVGPEGGFSDSEFDALDKSGARGISLGKTILRAEVAAVVALAKIAQEA